MNNAIILHTTVRSQNILNSPYNNDVLSQFYYIKNYKDWHPILYIRSQKPTARQAKSSGHSSFKICGNYMAHLVVLYFMNLPSLQFLVLHTCEELFNRNHTVW